MPAQMTIRADAALVERVRAMARRAGQSMNEQVVRILEAATDPDLAGDEVTRIRERLAAAGLLEEVPTSGPATPASAGAPVPADRLAAARARAGEGTPPSQLVSSAR